MNIVYVSRYLGHSSPEVTLRVYAKLLDSIEQDTQAAQVMEGVALGKVLENGAGERRRTESQDATANVALLAKSAGGRD